LGLKIYHLATLALMTPFDEMSKLLFSSDENKWDAAKQVATANNRMWKAGKKIKKIRSG
jgi:hypothetical protein